MIEFKKYSSIENHYKLQSVLKLVSSVPEGESWVVMEKVHGANFSLWYDGQEYTPAKRTSFINETELKSFYSCEDIVRKYEQPTIKLFSMFDDVESIVVHGELCGGAYPHPDVDRVLSATKIQKEVYYGPDNYFLVFDVSVNGELQEWSGDLISKLYAAGFEVCPVVEWCDEYPSGIDHTFQSKVPLLLGLPLLEDNICEGVVIKPCRPVFTPNGSRVIIKKKNEKFKERKKAKSGPKPEIADNVNQVYHSLVECITEPRFHAVISKIGSYTMEDFGTILSAYIQDMHDEIRSEFQEFYAGSSKSEQKILNKLVTGQVANFIRPLMLSGAVE